MFAVPTREDLAALAQAANAIVPLGMIGLVRHLGGKEASLLIRHANGISSHLVESSELPTVLMPSAGEPRQSTTAWIEVNPQGAVEWLFALGSIARVASIRLPPDQPE